MDYKTKKNALNEAQTLKETHLNQGYREFNFRLD